MSSQRLTEQFGAVDSEHISPTPGLLRLLGFDSKAEHCHTTIIHCMTASDGVRLVSGSGDGAMKRESRVRCSAKRFWTHEFGQSACGCARLVSAKATRVRVVLEFVRPLPAHMPAP